jgi:hypothetical protein
VFIIPSGEGITRLRYLISMNKNIAVRVIMPLTIRLIMPVVLFYVLSRFELK